MRRKISASLIRAENVSLELLLCLADGTFLQVRTFFMMIRKDEFSKLHVV